MTIDFHTHTFPANMAKSVIKNLSDVSNLTPYNDGTVDGLLKEMNNGGADISVILPVLTRPEQFNTVNASAIEINNRYSGKLISFAGIHPDCEDYKNQLKFIANSGLKGIKLHPDYQKTYIDDIRYMNIIDYASQLGLITVVHAGVDPGYPNPVHCTPKRARNVIDRIHPQKLVLAHMGGYDMWDEVEWYLAAQDVYFDTGFVFHGMDKKHFLKIVKHHGAEHILFATDSPWCAQKESIEWIKKLDLEEHEIDAILSDNARKLLGI